MHLLCKRDQTFSRTQNLGWQTHTLSFRSCAYRSLGRDVKRCFFYIFSIFIKKRVFEQFYFLNVILFSSAKNFNSTKPANFLHKTIFKRWRLMCCYIYGSNMANLMFCAGSLLSRGFHIGLLPWSGAAYTWPCSSLPS